MNPFAYFRALRETRAQLAGMREQLAAERAEIATLTDHITRHNEKTADEARLLALLRTPDRWQPDQPINALEAQDWAKLLTSPLLLKIDIAMVNMAQQQAQLAIHLPAADTVRAAGYAAGFRAAWTVAKSLSTLVGAQPDKSETQPGTDAPSLDHLTP